MFGAVATSLAAAALSTVLVQAAHALDVPAPDGRTAAFSLTDDSSGRPLLGTEPAVPGATVTTCVVLTAMTPVAADVRLYTSDPVGVAGPLAGHLRYTLTPGTGTAADGSCSGFRAAGAPVFQDVSLPELAALDSFAVSPSAWRPGPGAGTRTFRLERTFDVAGMSPEAVARLEGETAGLDLHWEMHEAR